MSKKAVRPGRKRDAIMASVVGAAFVVVVGMCVGWGTGLVLGVLTGIGGYMRVRQMGPWSFLSSFEDEHEGRQQESELPRQGGGKRT